jgi:Ca2+-binding EF-hand superfamily protein
MHQRAISSQKVCSPSSVTVTPFQDHGRSWEDSTASSPIGPKSHVSPHLLLHTNHSTAKKLNEKQLKCRGVDLLRVGTAALSTSGHEEPSPQLPPSPAALIAQLGMDNHQTSKSQSPVGFRHNVDKTPFSSSKSRHFVMERMSNLIADISRQSLPPLEPFTPEFGRNNKNPTSRSESIALRETYRAIRSQPDALFGKRLQDVITDIARGSNVREMIPIIDSEMNFLRVTGQELTRQVRLTCEERGEVLELILSDALALISTLSMTVNSACLAKVDYSMRLDHQYSRTEPLAQENKLLQQQLAAFQNENRQLKADLLEKDKLLSVANADLMTIKGLHAQHIRNMEAKFDEKVMETDAVAALMMSKLRVMESEAERIQAFSASQMVQLNFSKSQNIRDAASIEYLQDLNARYRISNAWFRSIVCVKRRAKLDRESISIQTDFVVGNMPESSSKPDSSAAVEIRSKVPRAQTSAIPFSDFWQKVANAASSIDVMKDLKYLMPKKELLMMIGEVYTAKIVQDASDDRSKVPRQTLPEFMYEKFLVEKRNPEDAEESLLKIMANIMYQEKIVPRIRAFGRFMSLSNSSAYSLEALNVYLTTLTLVNYDSQPILPHDSTHVDFNRLVASVEHIFGRVAYVRKQKVVQEAKKRFKVRHIDIDDFLDFVISEFTQENQRSEERLRALFVASDSDGDGNLDYDEFLSMIQHTQTDKSHSALVRMYSEMTLNKHVDCNTFVRVARKHRFGAFEIGPLLKKIEKPDKNLFDVLTEQWNKLQPLIHELLIILEGTATMSKLTDHIASIHEQIKIRKEPEMVFHLYHNLVSEMTTILSNRSPDSEITALIELHKPKVEEIEEKASNHSSDPED